MDDSEIFLLVSIVFTRPFFSAQEPVASAGLTLGVLLL